MLALFEALGRTAPGEFLRDSTLAFALTEAAHLLALSLIGGVVAAIGFSTAGVVVRRDLAPDLARALRPVFWIALVLVVVSGIGLVSAGPYKYYSNPVFWVKLQLLLGAVLTYLLVDYAVSGGKVERWQWRIVALPFLVVWLAVAVAGRLIGLI